MDYFLISQDNRLSNRVEPVGLGKALRENPNRNALTPLQLQITGQDNTEYVDFIERPLPLLSDRLKELWQVYEKRAAFAPLILADVRRGVQYVYWSLTPPKLQCLSSSTEFNQNATLKKLVINSMAVSGFRLFQIDQVMENLLIVNLLVLESMLRRNFTGFKFTKVTLESKS